MIENKEKCWMKRYKFGMMKRIGKLRKKNRKRDYVLKNVHFIEEAKL